MKLFVVLAFAIVALNLVAKPGEKIVRKLASINMESSSVISALTKNGFLDNSQNVVNGFTKTTTYKCPEVITTSELKDINLVSEKKDKKSFKFNGARMCFDQAGPGVVEVHYDGVIREVAGQLQVSDVKVKIAEDSRN